MKSLRNFLALLAVVGLPPLVAVPRAAAEESETVRLYRKVVDSAVFIVNPMKGGMSMGSGSLIDATKRYVLTNYHVVDESEMVFCQFPVYNKDGSMLKEKKRYIERIPAGQAFKGKVLYRDKTRDLAIVQLDRLPSTAKQIKLAKTSPATGERTWNIGNPGAVSQVFSVTGGEVRGVGLEDFVADAGAEVLRIKCQMVTATNPTNPGDSGGPLVNAEGEQVAVTESGSRSASNVNHFVDISEVRAFLREKKIEIKDDVPPKPETGSLADKSEPKAPTGTRPTPPATTASKTADPDPPAASPADEKLAGSMLARAKLFADGDDRNYYAKKLKEVIAKYPATAAAKEAQKLLDGLK